jgi:cyclopropane-fatty-acyl-phospholipid synthase
VLARERCRGLAVDIRVQDYRELHEEFDHIISIGMFEHVGYKNYRAYFEVAHRCLKDGGKFLLHTIGQDFSSHNADIWTQKYIFPNGMLPSIAQIGKGIEKLFVMEDWHNFGPDYDKTLMEWDKNFEAAWPSLKGKYGDRFYRMWRYYLLMSAGAFRSRSIQLWQVVLTKEGVKGGYRAVR